MYYNIKGHCICDFNNTNKGHKIDIFFVLRKQIKKRSVLVQHFCVKVFVLRYNSI